MSKVSSEFIEEINFRACARLNDLEYAEIYFKISSDQKLQSKALNPIGAASFAGAFSNRPRKPNRRRRRGSLRSIGSRIGRRRGRVQFDPNAIDGDDDGDVQDNTEWERPATAAQRLAGRARAKLRQRRLRRDSRKRREGQAGFYLEEQGPGFVRRTWPAAMPERKPKETRSRRRARDRVLLQAEYGTDRKPRRRVQRPEEMTRRARAEEARQSVAERQPRNLPAVRRVPAVDKEVQALNGIEGLGIINRLKNARRSIVDGEYIDSDIAKLVTSETQRRSDIYSRALKDNPDINLADFDESLGAYGESLNRLIERFSEWQESHRKEGRDFKKFIRREPARRQVFDADVVNPGLRALERQREDLDDSAQRFDRITTEGRELSESQEVDDLAIIDSLIEDYFGDEFLRQDEQDPPDSNMDSYVTELSEIDRRSLYEAKTKLDALRERLDDLSDDEEVKSEYRKGLSDAMDGKDKLIDRIYSRHQDLENARNEAYQQAQEIIWDEEGDELGKQEALLELFQDSPRAVRPTVLKAIDELGRFLNPEDPNSLHRSLVRNMLTEDNIEMQNDFRDFIRSEADFNEEKLQEWIDSELMDYLALFDEYGLPDTDEIEGRYEELNELFRKNQERLEETLRAIYQGEINREMPSDGELERFVRGVIEANEDELVSDEEIEQALDQILNDNDGQQPPKGPPKSLDDLAELSDEDLDRELRELLGEQEEGPQPERGTTPNDQVDAQKEKYQEVDEDVKTEASRLLDDLIENRGPETYRPDAEDLKSDMDDIAERPPDITNPYIDDFYDQEVSKLREKLSKSMGEIDDLLSRSDFDPNDTERALQARLEMKNLFESLAISRDNLREYREENWARFRREEIQELGLRAQEIIEKEDQEILNDWPLSKERLFDALLNSRFKYLPPDERVELINDLIENIDRRRGNARYVESINNLIETMRMSEDDLQVRNQALTRIGDELEGVVEAAIEEVKASLTDRREGDSVFINSMTPEDILDDSIYTNGINEFNRLLQTIDTSVATDLPESFSEDLENLLNEYREDLRNQLLEIQNDAKFFAEGLRRFESRMEDIEEIEIEAENKLLSDQAATELLDEIKDEIDSLGSDLIDFEQELDEDLFQTFAEMVNDLNRKLTHRERRLAENRIVNNRVSRPRLIESLSEEELEELDSKVESIINDNKERRRQKLEPIIKSLIGESNPWERNQELFEALLEDEFGDEWEAAYDLADKIFTINVNLNGFEFSTQVDDVSWDGTSLVVEGVIYADGEEVGVFGREITLHNKTVYNAYMRIDPEEMDSELSAEEVRGSGFASVFNTHAMLWYKGLGLQKVNVSAERDGTFVWPFTGFTQTGRATHANRAMSSGLKSELEKYDRGVSKIIQTPEAAKIAERLVERIDIGYEQIKDASSAFNPATVDIENLPPSEMEVLLALSANASKSDLYDWWKADVRWGYGTVYLNDFPDPRRQKDTQALNRINEDIREAMKDELVTESITARSTINNLKNNLFPTEDDAAAVAELLDDIRIDKGVVQQLKRDFENQLSSADLTTEESEGYALLIERNNMLTNLADDAELYLLRYYDRKFSKEEREALDQKSERLVEERKAKRTARLAEFLEEVYGDSTPWLGESNAKDIIERYADEGIPREQKDYLDQYLQRIFEIEHNGLYSEITAIESDSGRVSIRGRIRNEDGKAVGRFKREIDPKSKAIEHEELSIDEAYRGRGFGSVFNGHAELWYPSIGMNTINVQAIDDGTFVWPLTGFNEDIQRASRTLDTIFSGNAEIENLLNDQNRPLLKRLRDRVQRDRRIYDQRESSTPSDAEIILALMLGNEGRESEVKKWWKDKASWFDGTKSLDAIDRDPVGTRRLLEEDASEIRLEMDEPDSMMSPDGGDEDEFMDQFEVQELEDKAANLVLEARSRRRQRAESVLRQMYPEEPPWNDLEYVRDALIDLSEAEYESEEYFDALAQIEKFATDAFTVEFTTWDGKPFKTVVTEFSESGPGAFDVRGGIYVFDEETEEDVPVGYFDRVLNFDMGYVENDNLLIGTGSRAEYGNDRLWEFAQSVKNSGFGSAFNAHAFSFWKQSGLFNEVSIKMTGYDGKYVWGKLGFEADRTSQADLGREMKAELDKYYLDLSPEIIQTDEQARVIAAMLGYEPDGLPVQTSLDHEMVILSLLATGVPEADLKKWIELYAPVNSATLDLDTFEPPF